MVKIKKMVKSLSYLYVELQEHIEMAESFNVEMIRIKSNDKIVLKMFNDIDTARTRKFMGFKQVKFDKRGNKQFFSGCLMLYPSPDFYWYGYLPVTEDNLERLARMLKSGVVRIDEMDVEVSEQFDDLCDEKSISTALLPKRNYLGQSSSVEQGKKELTLAVLRERVAAKAIDDEIEELQEKLAKKNVRPVEIEKPAEPIVVDFEKPADIIPSKETIVEPVSAVKKNFQE